jgi:hypothetical protein
MMVIVTLSGVWFIGGRGEDYQTVLLNTSTSTITSSTTTESTTKITGMSYQS